MTRFRTLLERLVLVLIAAAFILIFHHVGGFKLPAAILLGGCFTVIVLWLYALWEVAAFKPYKVQIFVNFDTLREDLGLSTPSKSQDADHKPAREIYVFTAINAALFAHYQSYTAKTAEEMNITTDRLARSDEEYCSVIAFGDEIPCAFKPVHFDNPENRNPRASFFFRQNRGGYQFGIQVVPAWWIEHRKQLSTQMRDLPIKYEREIILASLPHGYIPDHVRRWDESVSLFDMFDIKQRRWKSKLSKHGWSMDENDPGHIDHRYLDITFCNL